MKQVKTFSKIGGAAAVLMVLLALPLAAQGTGILNVTGGNVGINTDDPTVKLHVLVGGTTFPIDPRIAMVFQNDATVNGAVLMSLIGGDGPSGNSAIAFGHRNNLGEGGISYHNGLNRMTFIANTVTRLTLNDSGADVNGSILQRGGVIHPDFVFEPDYELVSIDEQAEYMWENKHLPSVGPGRYDEDGRSIIDLGANSAAMLEELEKAHIYIAQLHERLNELESVVETLTQAE